MDLRTLIYFILVISLVTACRNASTPESSATNTDPEEEVGVVVIEAEDYKGTSEPFKKIDGLESYVEVDKSGWMTYDVPISQPGRYRFNVIASSENDTASVWLEDYIDNPDDRTYNITGSISVKKGNDFSENYVEGSPLRDTLHKMKLHVSTGGVKIDKIVFELMRVHEVTPKTYTQNTEGTEWSLVWSDEFDGDKLDTDKWTYDVGNWGWGNNELQYYTVERAENARLVDGHLIIEARKGDMGQKWTSARLTTRGKASFLYGKIEFKAKVPRNKGNWAAGWTLGDTYVDELSWPYCGEIDIMESVGYEVDGETGDGIAHCTVHTPAYYFKINNQISSVKNIKNIAGEFHTYAVEWTPEEIRGYVDGEHYYTYDKNANSREWPFNIPQNIILNLAMGGGWGGAQGMDPNIMSQILEIDYVRVYELM